MRCTCPICSWFVNPLTVKSSFVWILSLLLSAWVQKDGNSISKGMMRYQKIFRRPKTNSMECWLMTCQTFARKLWPVKIKLFLGHFCSGIYVQLISINIAIYCIWYLCVGFSFDQNDLFTFPARHKRSVEKCCEDYHYLSCKEISLELDNFEGMKPNKELIIDGIKLKFVTCCSIHSIEHSHYVHARIYRV